MQREEAEKPKRLLYRMKRYRSLLVCDQALLTREKLENDQSSNAEPLSGKPYGLPVGEGAAMPRPIRLLSICYFFILTLLILLHAPFFVPLTPLALT